VKQANVKEVNFVMSIGERWSTGFKAYDRNFYSNIRRVALGRNFAINIWRSSWEVSIATWISG
jgi:hypothetical protein